VTALRSVSYGAGVQSTALLVLAATGRIDYRLFLFANVGADSEHPATLAYLADVAVPYAAAHGVELVELHKVMRDGTPETLLGRLTKPGSRSLPIPVRMSNGAPGTRSCTADFKIRVIGRELRRRGATPATPATVALGISVDEIQRAHPGVDAKAPYQSRTYPLLDLGLHRSDCRRIIADAGLPIPPKSACWFCPFHDTTAWRRLERETPELWEQACQLDELLAARRAELGKDRVYFTRRAVPLRETTDNQMMLDLDDGCESGYCMT
jgi:hypothetical protein